MEAAEHSRVTTEIRMLLFLIMKTSARQIHQQLAAQDADINGLQFGIIRVLHHRPFTLSELSKRFVLDPSTLVPVVDTLEQKGLVERGRDPNDRRRTPLHLTDKGAAMVHDLSVIAEDNLLANSLNQLGEAKTLQLLELLRELVHAMPDGESILCDVQEHLSSC
jgi:DNA-binding MarR family transcriptional regulator